MKIIARNRCTGKSKQLIITSATTGFPIIAKTKAQCGYLLWLAEELDYTIPEPFTINEIKDAKHMGFEFESVLIDDGENIIKEALEKLIGMNVSAVTITI